MSNPTTTNNQNQQLECTKKGKKRIYWSEKELNILKEAVRLHGSDWKLIAEYLDGRNANQCAQRWKRTKPKTGKQQQKWDKSEDEKLMILVKEHDKDWSTISRLLPNRTGRQIRERYLNHLDPNILHEKWTTKEDLKIWKMYQKMGSKWSMMAKQLNGRPENMIKNRYYGYIRTKYGNQQNPYYQIPTQKRKLQIEDLNEIAKETLSEQVSNCENNYSDRHILVKFDSFSKMIVESNNDLSKKKEEVINTKSKTHKID